MRMQQPRAYSCPLSFALLVALSGPLAAATLTTKDDRVPTGSPNIILVSVDTLRADRLSSYGYERATSPNIDRLVEGGVRFDQARTVEPLTNPALSSMITGLYPHEHGGSRNGLRVRAGLASLPKTMQARGYRTAAFVGNWTLRDKLSGLREHFEVYEEVLTRKRWFGLVRREADARDITAGALEWVAEHGRTRAEQPFLLWVHYVEPHAPYRLHKEYLSQLGLEAKGLTDSDRYDTEIAFVDAAIGDLLEGLGAHSPESETLVIFTSDHGESLGEHNYWGHGRHLHDTTLHIPMALYWKDRLRPGTVDAPALIIDLAPTVLGLLGETAPAGFQGFDWAGVLGGEEPPLDRVTRYQAHRGAVISRHDSELARRAGLLEVGVLQKNIKEVFRVESGQRQLYNVAEDSGELFNLTPPKVDPTEGLLNWMRIVYNGLSQFEDAPPKPLDEESIEQLRSLGYVD